MLENENRKIAIVTGGSGGIGRAICVELARQGYYVIVNYRHNREGAENTLAELQAAGGAGEIVQFDVCDSGTAERVVDEVSRRWGRIEQ